MSHQQLKYFLIKETLEDSSNLLSLRYLCHLCTVSRSGYYHWKNVTLPQKKLKEAQDKLDFDRIVTAYRLNGYAKGHRSIYMTLLHLGIQMNRKKILRLMKKFKLKCPIRRISPHKQAAQQRQDIAIKPNLIQRQFKAYGPRMVLLTDITYLFYAHHQRAYLSVIKDAYTNEILAYEVSDSLEVDFVLTTLHKLMAAEGSSIKDAAMIHSDQGSHYTSIKFQELVKDYDLRQSMSRRGNCWDNAPQESFFGHMKDDLHLEKWTTLSEVTAGIDIYMTYYNEERYQWGLAKLSPRQYYDFYLSGIYPLAQFLPTPTLPDVRTCDVNESTLDTA